MLGTLAAISALVVPLLASPLGVSPLDAHTLFRRLSSGCSTTGTQSCHNTSTVANTCCFETGGLLPLVQVSGPIFSADVTIIHMLSSFGMREYNVALFIDYFIPRTHISVTLQLARATHGRSMVFGPITVTAPIPPVATRRGHTQTLLAYACFLADIMRFN
jgi:hypothetical protein